MSRMTIVTRGDEQILEQITKQLNKLIDIIKVIDFTDGSGVERELALIKVTAEDDSRAEVLRIVDIFRAKIIDVTPKSYTIEATGNPVKIDAILDLLRPLGLKELVRTGAVAIGRGAKGWKGEGGVRLFRQLGVARRNPLCGVATATPPQDFLGALI